jgi:hypothetical protein
VARTKLQSSERQAQESQSLQAELEALDAAAAQTVERPQQQVFLSLVPALAAAAIQPAFPLREAQRPAERAESQPVSPV